MYFNAETQLASVRKFHFALSNPGYLFLGKAEMLLNHSDRFEPVDLRMRLFRKNGISTIQGRVNWNSTASLPEPLARMSKLQTAAVAAGPVAQIVLDASGNVAFVNARAEGLFGVHPPDTGRPFQDLEVSYRPVELRSVIDQVVIDRRAVELRDVTWRRAGIAEPSVFDISVVPLQEPGGELVGAAINFHDVTRYRRLRDELEQANRELEQAYEELQSLNEELETTNEELQSTNEELETTNEELQSTNEELETMNEELQSSNDELQQINDTLNTRSLELDHATRLISAVVRSLGDAVAVFDHRLRVMMWSPGAEELWGLRADEATGSPLSSLDIGLPVDRLLPDIQRILAGEAGPDGQAAAKLTVDAVNRRGRPTRLSVTLSPLHEDDASLHGLLMIMTVQ
jgi:two-component system CheB/CheR fusion protein